MPYLYTPPPARPCSLKSTRCTDLHRPPPPYTVPGPHSTRRAPFILPSYPAPTPLTPYALAPPMAMLTPYPPCILAHTVPWGCAVAQVARYASSQRYVEHYDGVDPHTDAGRSFCASGGQRVATVLMYLTDVRCPPPHDSIALSPSPAPREGTTSDPLDCCVHIVGLPPPALLLSFPTRCPHFGPPRFHVSV